MPLELLLIHSDNAVRRALRDAFVCGCGSQVVAHHNARNALASYARARFDGIVCAPAFTDIDAWRFMRMLRSGRFGFPGTPVVVACTEDERTLYGPIVESNTYLLELEGDPLAFARRIESILREHPRPSLLLVEDEPAAAAPAMRALEKYFRVELAEDGFAAIDAWHARRHELVVLDLMLPKLSGQEVQERILRINPHQPIIILTAFDAPERCEGLMLGGATDFLAKPINLTQFAGHCLRVLQEAKYVHAAQHALGAREKLGMMSERVRAASFRLARGQTRAAREQLQHALAVGPIGEVNDDTWAALVAQYPTKPEY